MQPFLLLSSQISSIIDITRQQMLDLKTAFLKIFIAIIIFITAITFILMPTIQWDKWDFDYLKHREKQNDPPGQNDQPGKTQAPE